MSEANLLEIHTHTQRETHKWPNSQKGRGFSRNLPKLVNNTPKQDNTSHENIELGQQIRKIYNLIRQVHHLDNVTVKEDAENNNKKNITFKRLTDYLNYVIKPASMTENTRQLLEGNARNWAYTTKLIQEDHYMEGIYYEDNRV